MCIFLKFGAEYPLEQDDQWKVHQNAHTHILDLMKKMKTDDYLDTTTKSYTKKEMKLI